MYDFISPEKILWSIQISFSNLLLLYIPIFLADVALAVILGFCVYYHARSVGNRKAAMWGVLSGFFSVAALVYLIVQIASKPKPLYCPRCGCPAASFASACPQCGAPLLPTTDAVDDATAAYLKRRSRILLIAWIVLYAVSLALTILVIRQFINEMFELLCLLAEATSP